MRHDVQDNKKGYSATPTNFETNKSASFRRAVLLEHKHWQNISASRSLWYEYNQDVENRTKFVNFQHNLLLVIQNIITSGLTVRQKEVLTMYYLYDHTQVFIARKLGISQPTVNQHLKGKIRNGKRIGGSIKKIRKMIHRMPASQHTSQNSLPVMDIMDQLLNASGKS